MQKTKLFIGVIIGSLLFSGGVSATDNPHQKITIEGLRPAVFNHDTHLVHDLACGVCHHKSHHEPYSDEEVIAQSDSFSLHCRYCHNKQFGNKKLRSLKVVFHKQCKSCHQIGVDGVKGPTRCIGCHKEDSRTGPDSTVRKYKNKP